jgi:hypothetical protein
MTNNHGHPDPRYYAAQWATEVVSAYFSTIRTLDTPVASAWELIYDAIYTKLTTKETE